MTDQKRAQSPAEVAVQRMAERILSLTDSESERIVHIINEAHAEERAELQAFRDEKERARTIVSCSVCKGGGQYKFMIETNDRKLYCQGCAAVALSDLSETLDRHDRMAACLVAVEDDLFGYVEPFDLGLLNDEAEQFEWAGWLTKAAQRYEDSR